MAEHDHRPTDGAAWDGRFGERFDDEVSNKAVAWTIVGTGLITVIAIILMYALFHALVPDADEDAVTQQAPPLPRLQADPEGELEAYRAELEERLEGYGWVDEAAGIAHIPIDEAIALLAEQGLPSAPAATSAAAPAEDGATTDEGAVPDEGGEAEP